jgi:hypothetical protein
MTEVYIEKTSKQIFEVEQIQLARTLRKEFEEWEAQIHYQDLHTRFLVCNYVFNTIQNIIQNDTLLSSLTNSNVSLK